MLPVMGSSSAHTGPWAAMKALACSSSSASPSKQMCIRDRSHGVGWCAPQQGACKLTLNVKNGIIEEALVETLGCSGMTHSAAMAAEILPGKTLLECLNTDLVCDAINVAMREIFKQPVSYTHLDVYKRQPTLWG